MVQSGSHRDLVNSSEQIKRGPWQMARSRGMFSQHCVVQLNNVDDYRGSVRSTRVPEIRQLTFHSDVSLGRLYDI